MGDADETRPMVTSHLTARLNVCGHRWYAPRPEVDDAYATHVCFLEPGHEGVCLCWCGAKAKSGPTEEELDDG